MSDESATSMPLGIGPFRIERHREMNGTMFDRPRHAVSANHDAWLICGHNRHALHVSAIVAARLDR